MARGCCVELSKFNPPSWGISRCGFKESASTREKELVTII